MGAAPRGHAPQQRQVEAELARGSQGRGFGASRGGAWTASVCCSHRHGAVQQHSRLAEAVGHHPGRDGPAAKVRRLPSRGPRRGAWSFYRLQTWGITKVLRASGPWSALPLPRGTLPAGGGGRGGGVSSSVRCGQASSQHFCQGTAGAQTATALQPRPPPGPAFVLPVPSACSRPLQRSGPCALLPPPAMPCSRPALRPRPSPPSRAAPPPPQGTCPWHRILPHSLTEPKHPSPRGFGDSCGSCPKRA